MTHPLNNADRLDKRLEADGFLVLDDVFAPQEMATIRAELLRQFQAGVHDDDRSVAEIGSQHGSILELNRPAKANAILTDSTVYRAVIKVSRQIFGCRVFSDFDHAILKPPRSGAPTSWHQDEAYHPLSSRNGAPLRRLHWWVPLQDTAAQNGGMVYLPGSHLNGLQRHSTVTSQDGTVRRVLAPAACQAVEATVRLGGAAIHLPRTIHMAQPNASGEARLAWIIQVRAGSPSMNAIHYGFRNFANRCIKWISKRSAAACV